MSIADEPGTEPVDDYERAYCPECDANYGVHVDGHCPQCLTELDFEPDYEALLVDGVKGVVRQLAREHAPDPEDDYPVCTACHDDTPLSIELSSDVPKASAFDDVVADAESAVEQLGGDAHWVRTELADAYIQAFYNAQPDPEDCFICRAAAVSNDRCGHDEMGVECPIRSNYRG